MQGAWGAIDCGATGAGASGDAGAAPARGQHTLTTPAARLSSLLRLLRWQRAQ